MNPFLSSFIFILKVNPLKNCIFCQIASKLTPSYHLFEDELTFSFLDTSPGTAGHTLVIPKNHYQDLFDAPHHILSQMIKISQKIALALKKSLNFQGINLFQNTGKAAGQSVFHIHFHLFPRWNNDHALSYWKPKSLNQSQFQKIQSQIQSQIQNLNSV